MKAIKCLDKGFVKLIDHMGDDTSIVQAARVSYGEGTKSPEQDKKLINYLMKHRHTSPFEMVEFKFHVKLPIFVARQWIRHRTASVNELSGRYTQLKDEYYLPELTRLQTSDKLNKQGSGGEVDNPVTPFGLISTATTLADGSYKALLDSSLSKELSRIVLPLSTYTEWYWKIDLHNLFHFLQLRLDSHAQYEIRVYAEAIADIIKEIVPDAYEAFEMYRLNAMTLDKYELDAIAETLSNEFMFNNEIIINDILRNYANNSQSGKAELKNKLVELFGVDDE